MKVDPVMPAFPVFSPESGTSYGIDIRTHLAAMAMQGILANQRALDAVYEDMPVGQTLAVAVADGARVMADALIAELNK